MEVSAGAGVEALGALADDHEVDVAGLDVGQRGGRARVEATGPQVDVLIEFEAEPQQQAAFEDARRDRGSPMAPRRIASWESSSDRTPSGRISPVAL
ncbi:hypothetical protein GCM10029992_40220 [Glycomyces albus]